MPLRGLFDFDGNPILMAGEDFFGRTVFPLVATPDVGPEAPSNPLGSTDGDVDAPASPIIDLGGLFGGGDDTPSDTPAEGPFTLNDWVTSLFGGDNDAPDPPPASGEDGYWLTVGLLGGRVWVPAEADADELNSMVVCPADPPSATGTALLPFDLFGNF